jgi:hypothetical protein
MTRARRPRRHVLGVGYPRIWVTIVSLAKGQGFGEDYLKIPHKYWGRRFDKRYRLVLEEVTENQS